TEAETGAQALCDQCQRENSGWLLVDLEAIHKGSDHLPAATVCIGLFRVDQAGIKALALCKPGV
ncbi:hypothetical protein, partial [Gilvimarinus sp. 1_MG-2023]|uniref:hypothetical protein n=1 Tax=Gilvimarinus sp. 1_MG-2023 TaxID=3062638 RepID=UPI0026E33F4A